MGPSVTWVASSCGAGFGRIVHPSCHYRYNLVTKPLLPRGFIRLVLETFQHPLEPRVKQKILEPLWMSNHIAQLFDVLAWAFRLIGVMFEDVEGAGLGGAELIPEMWMGELMDMMVSSPFLRLVDSESGSSGEEVTFWNTSLANCSASIITTSESLTTSSCCSTAISKDWS